MLRKGMSMPRVYSLVKQTIEKLCNENNLLWPITAAVAYIACIILQYAARLYKLADNFDLWYGSGWGLCPIVCCISRLWLCYTADYSSSVAYYANQSDNSIISRSEKQVLRVIRWSSAHLIIMVNPLPHYTEVTSAVIIVQLFCQSWPNVHSSLVWGYCITPVRT